MKKVLTALILSMILLSLTGSFASATERWNAGNNRYGTYGTKADIQTPYSKPDLGDAIGEAGWVSTPASNSIQTGWVLWPGWSNAQSYTEVIINDHQTLQYCGTHSWGSYKNYKVCYDDNSDCWRAYINNTLYHSVWGGVPDPPVLGQANAEVIGSPDATVNTNFTAVQWMDSDGDWHYYDAQSVLMADPPYAVTGSYPTYTAYGPN